MTSPDSTPPGPVAPAEWEADVVLRDGATMQLRPMLPSDADALVDFHEGLSEQSQYFRFFAPMPRLSAADLHRFTNVDHGLRVALILLEGPAIKGVGRYDVIDPGVAEVAFAVADTEHGRGLGSILLEHVVAAARERGVHTFVADVLPDNTQMINVFKDAGYEVRSRYDDGVVSIEIPLRRTGRSWEVLAERERRAESLSMHSLTAARAALVVALDETGRAAASRVLARAAAVAGPEGTIPLVSAGPLDPVGPAHHADLAALAAADELPEVDLALLAGEAGTVVDAIPVLRGLGVRAVVVLTGGFARGAGRELQLDLLRATRLAGLRVLGPASYGVVGEGEAGPYDLTLTDPHLGEDLPAELVGGRGIGVFAQTREAAQALRRAAANRRLPEVAMLAAGNRIDVSGNDTMQGWSADEKIAVGVVHLQTLGNARKFTRIARRLSSDRALVVLTSATTAVATMPGHAVATSALPPSVIDSVLAQAGALPARSVGEALDLAGYALTQPVPPAGTRVALAATSHSLAATLLATAKVAGLDPVGEVLVLDGGAVHARERLQGLVLAEEADAVVLAVADVLGPVDGELLRAVAEAAAADPDRPWVAWVDGLQGLDDRLRSGEHILPAVGSVEVAVRAVALRAAAASRRDTDTGALVEPEGTDPLAARAAVDDVLPTATSGESVPLDEERVTRLLAAYGVDVLPTRRVHAAADEDEDVARAAVAVAEEVGYPVAVKAADVVLRHRTDLGGVRFDLLDADDVTAAVSQVRERARAVLGRETDVELQAMTSPGVAVVVRGGEDPVYGPVVSVGLAGDASEILGDVTYRVAPVTAGDVTTMIADLRAAPRLMGDRGLNPVDTPALEDLLGRVAALVDDLPQVAELVMNPVIVSRSGLSVAGARVVLRAPNRLDAGRRALPRPSALDDDPHVLPD